MILFYSGQVSTILSKMTRLITKETSFNLYMSHFIYIIVIIWEIIIHFMNSIRRHIYRSTLQDPKIHTTFIS